MMIWLPEIRRRILVGLRHEPLDHFALAASLGEAPFRIRAELKELKRDRLVNNRINGGRILWHLTDRGDRIAHHEAQTELAL